MHVRFTDTLAVAALGALALCACGSAVTPAPEAPEAPETEAPAAHLRVDGLVAYPAPIDEAPSAVIALHRSLEEVLAHDVNPPADRRLSTMQRWTERVFAAFMQEHRARVLELEGDAAELANGGGPDELRLAAIVVGHAWQDFHARLEATPVPDEIAEDDALDRIYRDALRGASVPLAHRAAAAFERCARLSPFLAPEMAEWSRECAARAERLAAVEAPTTPARTPDAPAPTPVEWPSECATQRWPVTPEAPAPRRARAEAVAVRYVGPDLEEAGRAALLAAVRDELDRRLEIEVLSMADIEAAERLRREHRVSRGGPRCGQPPPLGWVLSRAHPNLMFADVGMTCDPTTGRDDCRLWVDFERPGEPDATDLPGMLSGPIASESADRWPRAAAALGPTEPSAGLFLAGSWHAPARVRVFEDDEEDPWLRLSTQLANQREALAACAPSDGVRARAFRARFRVSRTGRTSDVEVEPTSNATPADAECVNRVLRDQSWPCTPSDANHEVQIGICLAPPPLSVE